MGACCSCFDAISGGKHSSQNGSSSTEMTSRNTRPKAASPLPHTDYHVPCPHPPFDFRGSPTGMAKIPIEQDAAYWEWHVDLPGLPRHPDDNGDENEDRMHSVNMDEDNDNNDDEDDPYALKFGVATRKDRHFYKSLENVEEEGDEASSRDDGTVLMRPIANLRHNDVIGVAVQQSDLPMIQFLLNGEPLPECTINRFRGTCCVWPIKCTERYIVISCVAKKLELSSYFELAGLTFLDRESSSNTPLSMASNDQCCAAQGSMGPWYDKMNKTFTIMLFANVINISSYIFVVSHVFATLKIPVRSLTSYLRRKTASFSICSIINHCSACGDVSSFTRGLTLSFGSDISAKFGPRLFEAFMCHESNIVDSSFIVAIYKALVYAASAYRNPRSIFLNLLEEYTSSNSDTRCDYKKLGDVLKIVSIAAVTNSEVGRTSGLLQDQLTKTCGGGSTRLTIVELEKALDSCPSIIDHFRLQLVNQMPSDDKIELLCALENESLGAFIEASKAIGTKRMHAFKMRSLLRCFDAWRMEVQLSHRVTKRRKKTALSAWNKEAQRLKMAKVLEEVSLVTGYTALMRRSFIRWRRLNAVKTEYNEFASVVISTKRLGVPLVTYAFLQRSSNVDWRILLGYLSR
ncbi:SPRY domain-containing protein [Skeletonema marinoi]|uniref:SPRY domain-containing protein n=1 Tax=Skeletonema marinoi TaxID=267567 RepID=A0AAD8YBZ5_9STRA|nr:SPRY domain-containing protein [Skeletonema marinoi]